MLGSLLRDLRTRAGLRADDVAEALGLDRSTIYSWEQDGRPRPENLAPALDLYNATADQRLEAWRLRSLPKEPSTDDPSGAEV